MPKVRPGSTEYAKAADSEGNGMAKVAHLILAAQAQVVRPQQVLPERAGGGEAVRVRQRAVALLAIITLVLLLVDCS